jgi:UDP-2,3-diacylglucosamine pyrophosphatase LpxH
MLDGIRKIARQYDRVILNGDTLDRYEAPKCEPESEELLCDALDACRSASGAPELLSGNHDPAISAEHWLYLPQSKTLVFHGDCLCDLTHPTREKDRYLASRLHQRWGSIGGRPRKLIDLAPEHRAVQTQVMREQPPIEEPKTLFGYLLSTVYPPQKPFQILHYWSRVPKLAAELALTVDQSVRHVVIGHTHYAGRWSVKGLMILNTGSYMPLSIPHAVCIDGEDVQLVRMSKLLATHRSVFFPLTPQPEVSKRIEISKN